MLYNFALLPVFSLGFVCICIVKLFITDLLSLQFRIIIKDILFVSNLLEVGVVASGFWKILGLIILIRRVMFPSFIRNDFVTFSYFNQYLDIKLIVCFNKVIFYSGPSFFSPSLYSCFLSCLSLMHCSKFLRDRLFQ